MCALQENNIVARANCGSFREANFIYDKKRGDICVYVIHFSYFILVLISVEQI